MTAEPRLLESAVRRWWVVAIAFAVTTVLTVLWVSPKPAVYESSGTYVVQPRTAQGADSVRALEALIRGTQINATYALIARSDSIKDTAEARLTSIPENAHLRLEAEAVTGTNALSISARARNAESAHALAVAAGVETIAYVDALQQPYELVLLDPPELPSSPVNSRKSLTIVLGALLGLMLGLGMAALMDRIVMLPTVEQLLRRARTARTLKASAPVALEEAEVEPAAPTFTPEPTDPPITAEPAAPRVTTASSDPPIDLVAHVRSDPAVRDELAAAADRAATYSLGVLELEPANWHDNGHNGDGNQAENGAGATGEPTHFEPLLHEKALRNGRTLTYVRDGVFAVVLPETSAVNASELLSDWLAAVSDIDTDEPSAGLLVSMTVVEYTAPRAAEPAAPRVTTASSDPPIDLVAHVRSDPAVRDELAAAADRAATYSLGVLELEPANWHDNGHNGDGNQAENGAGATGEPTHFEPLLHEQALRNGRTLTYVRDGVFAVVLPETSAVNASELLSDWLAAVSDIDTDEPSAGLLVSMTVVEYTAPRASVVAEVTS